MKKQSVFFLAIGTLMALVAMSQVDARGGGGREGGGGRFSAGGDFRANSINRIPSMSRASSWSPNTAPKTAGQSTLLSQPSSQLGSPGGDSRAQLEQFLGQNRSIQPSALSQVSQARNFNANKVRRGIDQAYSNRGDWFGNQFWSDHNFYPAYAAADSRRNWWAAATWDGLDSWWGMGGDVAPIYYENGEAYSVPQTSQNGSGTVSAANGAFADSNQSSSSTTNSDWLSLGVFALTNAENSETQPAMYFQMAVNKEGNISGTYYNQPSDQVSGIEGLVDKTNQKAVWKMTKGQNSPIFQTGIYNLTLQETPITVNFGDQSQNWQMIRVNKT